MPTTQPSLSRRWFVLSGVSYQGPFTEIELNELLGGGAMARESLLWREGFDQWLPLGEVEEFRDYVSALPPVSEVSLVTALSSEIDFIDGDEHAGGREPEPAVPESTPDSYSMSERRSNEDAWLSFFEKSMLRHGREERAREGDEARPRWSSWLAGGAIAMGAAAITGAILMPSIFAQRSSIRHLEGITTEERQALEAVSRASLRREGTRASLAVARLDVFAPWFVVASNLPDGTILKLQVEGLSETLIDQFKVSMKTTAVVRDAVARTPVFRQENGAAYPMGQYRVVVSCADCPGAEQLLAQKTFFLGKENDPGEYDRRLADYHSRLRRQAQDELLELRQLSQSLANQLNESDSEFHRVLGMTPAARAKAWREFHGRWNGFQEQLDAAFSHWTPESLEGAYFHSDLFATLRRLGEKVREQHRLRSEYLAQGVPPGRSVEVSRIDSSAVEVRALIRDLLERVRLTSELPAAPSGMPARLISR